MCIALEKMLRLNRICRLPHAGNLAEWMLRPTSAAAMPNLSAVNADGYVVTDDSDGI